MRDQIVATDRELLRCESCDYILDTQSSQRCPECAHPVDWDAICTRAIETNRDQFKYLWYTELSGLPLDNLRCLKCDYRLLGLTAHRCPECGQKFEWDDVVDGALRNSAKLFEYQWYASPAASFAQTLWLGAVRPFRLWKAYSDAPGAKAGPLLFLILIQWLMFARGWQTMALVIDPLMNALGKVLMERSNAPTIFTYSPHLTQEHLVDYGIWSIGTLLTLQLFVQSNRQYHASWTRVLRVFAHATLFASLCTAIACLFEAALDATLFAYSWPRIPGVRVGGIPPSYYVNLHNSAMGLALFSTWAYLWIGYRRHLHIPHGWAIAAVALFVGHLLAQLARTFILV